MYVCLIGENGRKLIPGSELQPGTSTATFHAKRFEITLGNASVTMVIDGTAEDRAAIEPGDRLRDHEGLRSPAAPAGPAADLHVSVRAGIVVTGTEVLSGRVSDRNGPWLAERLRELGVDLGYTAIVGDRPEDMEAALRFMAEQGMELIVTSGGLGPTADDLTAEVVGGFQGREMVLDEALSERIAEIVRPLMKRWPNIDREAIRAANRKQATIPAGATVLEPVGTAPGLVVPPGDREGPERGAGRHADRRSWCFPARRASCSRCGRRRSDRGAAAALGGRDHLSPADAAAVRDPRVGDRRDAARGRTRRESSSSAWRSRRA